MNTSRTNSYPDLLPLSPNSNGPIALEGVTTNLKLLLKLLQDHQDPANNPDGNTNRLSTILSILDDVRTRIIIETASTASTTSSSKPSSPKELRRCNTDLRRSSPKNIPKPPTSHTEIEDDTSSMASACSCSHEEVQRLRREVAGSVAARKSLEKMFAGVGKEKELIARELAKKVQELACTEELVNDLKKQNETLTAKVRVCCAEHRWKKAGQEVILQERNKALSEQLLKSLDGYRSLKRKMKEERERLQTRLVEMAEEAAVGEDRVRRVREWVHREENIGSGVIIEEEMVLIEKAFSRFYKRMSGRVNPN